MDAAPESVAEIVAALQTLAADGALSESLSAAGSDAARRYSRPALAAKMLNVLEAVAGQ